MLCLPPIPPPLQYIESIKAALARPGRLTAALSYYRAALCTATKWASALPDTQR